MPRFAAPDGDSPRAEYEALLGAAVQWIGHDEWLLDQEFGTFGDPDPLTDPDAILAELWSRAAERDPYA